MKRSLFLLAGLCLGSFNLSGVRADFAGISRNVLFAAVATRRSKASRRCSESPWVDYSLYSGVVATHAADWASSEQCLRVSQEQEQAGFVGLCHEGLLPTALVENKVGLAAYETTMAGLEIYSQYLLTKHHHKRTAGIVQFANANRHYRVCGSAQLQYAQ